ncbi:MAG: ferredoxin [Nocardioides sp.]|jgi:NAD-dependent dihydropyrimidine dehydrogenase PreA subunit|uniref:ferredoxin n=1 Tax=Nocardioides sp. TaxID=35761 RepID=UPI00261A63F7|nr:ferredoxin [Nocardioides sp.]MCW2835029.1 ferredoxin [Nocardioides sp.]
MPYVVSGSCVDVMDRSCVEECPVDCIYEGSRKMYIQPAECIDCGACALVCPVDAIHSDGTLPDEQAHHKQDNLAFFVEILPGLTEPLGVPGGATALGPVDADTPSVSVIERSG